MSLRPPNMPVTIIAGIVAALVLRVVNVLSPIWRSKLDAIPTVGSGGWFSAWWAPFMYAADATEVIQRGYDEFKHKSTPFKVTQLNRWMVIFSNREHVEEIQRAPVDTLSFAEVLRDVLHVEDTMGPEVHHNPYHVQIVRSRLTRNLGVLYPEIRDEVIAAFDDVLDLRGSEWKSVPALSSIQKVVCRTSNRMFVGLPLCRDPDWIDLNIRYTVNVVARGFIIGLFPKLLRPIAAQVIMSFDGFNQRGGKFLGPVIEERRKYLDERSREWIDKPNDFLSWLMEEAEGPESTVKFLTTRILVVNFQAIHTSSQSFTHALFYLAANPQYIQPLREEVEEVVRKGGWMKAAVGKMRKVDSFLRECQRMETLNCVNLQRKALKDLTLPDGTFVPKGATIAVAARSIHLDEAIYENALAFEPFRFVDLSEEDGDGAKHQLVSTSAEYLVFGHGRQACPGRFFAATELKTMLAHVVVTYDVRLEEGAAFPRALRFVTANTPNPHARVMFRRRLD